MVVVVVVVVRVVVTVVVFSSSSEMFLQRLQVREVTILGTISTALDTDI